MYIIFIDKRISQNPDDYQLFMSQTVLRKLKSVFAFYIVLRLNFFKSAFMEPSIRFSYRVNTMIADDP